MRVVYIVPSIVRSGPIRVVEHLVNGLSEKEKVDLFYLEERSDRQLIDFGNHAKKISFFEAIDFDKYDIIHSHTIKADAYLWWHRKRIKHSKIISTVHNLAYEDLSMQYGPLKGKILANFWGKMLQSFDGIVCLTAGAVDYYKKRWRGVNILSYVYNGIDAEAKECIKLNRINVLNSSRKKIGIIASAGGVGERKGIDQVIRALVDLPEFELYVAGKNTETTEKLKSLAYSLYVKDKVHFLGFIEDIDCFIKSMDLMVAPSRSEGFGLGILEIVRANKPLICSDIPTFREVFKEDEVFFFPLEDTKKLSNIIRFVAMSKDSMHINKAYMHFLKDYTVKSMVRKYIEIYKNLINSNKK